MPLYIALYSPNDHGKLLEVQAADYYRAIFNPEGPTPSSITVEFPIATTTWGTVTEAAIIDDTGRPYIKIPLQECLYVYPGITLRISLSLDDAARESCDSFRENFAEEPLAIAPTLWERLNADDD